MCFRPGTRNGVVMPSIDVPAALLARPPRVAAHERSACHALITRAHDSSSLDERDPYRGGVRVRTAAAAAPSDVVTARERGSRSMTVFCTADVSVVVRQQQGKV
jgi:hypothetical protein